MIDLEKLDALCEAADNGPSVPPCECDSVKSFTVETPKGQPRLKCECLLCGFTWSVPNYQEGHFRRAVLAWKYAARQAVPELVAEVRELRRHTAKLESALDEVTQEADDA